MISLAHLNKLILFIIFFLALSLKFSYTEEEPADIWKNNNNELKEINQSVEEEKIIVDSPILSDEVNKMDNAQLEEKINISEFLQVDNNDVCSKQNIVMNTSTEYINGKYSGNVSTEYDPGF